MEDKILSAAEFAALNADLTAAANSTLQVKQAYKASKKVNTEPKSWIQSVLNFLLY